MKHKEYKVGNEKLPCAFSTDVIMRMYKTEKEIKAFWESYNQNKLSVRAAIEPNETQYKIAEMKKKGITNKEIAKKMGMKEHNIHHAIHRVAVWTYMNN